MADQAETSDTFPMSGEEGAQLMRRFVAAHEKLADSVARIADTMKESSVRFGYVEQSYVIPMMQVINGFLDTYRAHAGEK